jgi:hypothetical protein
MANESKGLHFLQILQTVLVNFAKNKLLYKDSNAPLAGAAWLRASVQRFPALPA